MDAASPSVPEAASTIGATSDAHEPDDPMAQHLLSKEDLIALAAAASGSSPTRALVDGISPVAGRFNQGNRALARHSIGKSACAQGLRDVVLQTPEQRARCHDRDNMVPIYRNGDPTTAAACIDVFEYPNRACELPFVWGTPAEAEALCRVDGKRLCSQREWNLACAGDPDGGKDRDYAYGDELDLTICNTNKPHPFGPDGRTWVCSAQTAQIAWSTCATETEPSGSFPRCRSRFGVFDQHGNVAEMMTRTGTEGETLTQLKGSAFFYVDVAREKTAPQKPGGRETYPDHCAFDPRWHVELLKDAQHSNYHLGFRCCLGL